MLPLFDLIELPLVPTIAVGGWFLSAHKSQWARRAGQASALIVGSILLIIAGTGWLWPGEPAAVVHRWTGHVLLIVVWLLVPLSVGIVLQQQIRRRPFMAVAQGLLLLLLVGVTLMASFTGYLRMPEGEPFAEETNNRFFVLHQLALPFLIGAIVAEWFWYFLKSKGHPNGRAS